MKILIIGAGEVGKGLSETLCFENNDVIMIDRDEVVLEALSETLDIMTIQGNGAHPTTLMKADMETVQLVIAVTNMNEVNVLSCQVAKYMNKDVRTIARVSEVNFFDERKGIAPKNFGIDHLVVPHIECAEAILETIIRPDLKELVNLSTSGAVIAGFQINPGSPMIGTQLNDFPRSDLLNYVRVCAIQRRGKMIIPRGKAFFNNYDEIYIAGDRTYVDQFITWASIDEQKVQNIVIVGSSPLGIALAQRLVNKDFKVKVIEPDEKKAERALDTIGKKVTVLNGDCTESEVLEEAGGDSADVFVSTLNLDESNVLSCLLAKRLGARKVITVTNKPDYREIIASMDSIDSSFSPRIAALNTIIQQIKGSDRQIGALLHRIEAEVLELSVLPKSKIADKKVSDDLCPEDAVFAMILRGNVIIPATGSAVFKVGDRVVIVGTQQAMKTAEQLFISRSLF